MVFGFPGRTQQFLPTEAVRQIMQQGDPDKIKIRDFKLAQLAADNLLAVLGGKAPLTPVNTPDPAARAQRWSLA